MEPESLSPCSQQPTVAHTLSLMDPAHAQDFPAIHFNIIFPYRPTSRSSKNLEFLIRILYAFQISSTRATCPANHILLAEAPSLQGASMCS
jgi:hypothetical protein